MAQYANLLAKLAGNEVVNRGEFSQIERLECEYGVRGVEARRAALERGARLLFQGRGPDFQEIIERKRRKKLRQATEAQQPRIQDYAGYAQDALRLVVVGVKLPCDTDYEALANQFIDAGNDSAKQSALQKILDRNRQMTDTLRTFEWLGNSYSKLPEAHADLVRAVDERQAGLGGILDFCSETVALHDLFKSLQEEQ